MRRPLRAGVDETVLAVGAEASQGAVDRSASTSDALDDSADQAQFPNQEQDARALNHKMVATATDDVLQTTTLRAA